MEGKHRRKGTQDMTDRVESTTAITPAVSEGGGGGGGGGGAEEAEGHRQAEAAGSHRIHPLTQTPAQMVEEGEAETVAAVVEPSAVDNIDSTPRNSDNLRTPRTDLDHHSIARIERCSQLYRE